MKMLCVNNYTRKYIEECRSKVAKHVAAYRALICSIEQERLEKKDGNPLNEVRILCNSMMNNNDLMCADKTVKFDPAKSV
jgi:hypothetical protein